MNILYLITARGGSKGVPKKNIQAIGGLSLVGWKAWAARDCDPAADVFCSTDSQEIAGEARRHGCLIIDRPAALATDDAKSADVVKHALAAIDRKFDAVMLLEPSSPFATGAHMHEAVRRLGLPGTPADLVVGMRAVEPHSTFVAERAPDDSVNNIVDQMRKAAGRRRQDFHPEWTMNGALYLFRVGMFLKTGDVYGGEVNVGLLMERWNSIEIDTPHDLELARYAHRAGFVTPPKSAPEEVFSAGFAGRES